MGQPPSTTFRVRSAVAADDAALTAIDATAWSADSGFPSVIAAASQPRVTFFTADNPPGILLVAESCGEGEVIGYIRVKPPTRLAENAHVLHVAGLAVLASARGQGVAAGLLAAAERYAIEQGARKLSLRVLATNAPAIRLYKRLGFVSEGTLVGEFLIDGRYVDDMFMAKRLDEGDAVTPVADRPAEPLVADQPTAYEQEPPRPPAGATELLLIRHGQSQAYVDGTSFPLAGGHGDPPLSAHGHEQASRLCARLGTEDIGAIYVTTLRRTTQTAEPLAARLGLAVRVEPDLREVHLGEWEGGEFRKRVAEADPIALRMFDLERWDVIPGAEPDADFAGRVRAAIGRLVAGHPGERVAAFTHGGVIGQVLALATGSRPFAFIGADNASISRLLVVDGRWIIRGFNDTAHLS